MTPTRPLSTRRAFHSGTGEGANYSRCQYGKTGLSTTARNGVGGETLSDLRPLDPWVSLLLTLSRFFLPAR